MFFVFAMMVSPIIAVPTAVAATVPTKVAVAPPVQKSRTTLISNQQQKDTHIISCKVGEQVIISRGTQGGHFI